MQVIVSAPSSQAFVWVLQVSVPLQASPSAQSLSVTHAIGSQPAPVSNMPTAQPHAPSGSWQT